MEEYDELSAGPGEAGEVDLSHSAWSELPDQLFSFSGKLLSLNLSHNKLVEIEDDFSQLTLLSTLNLECNVITRITPKIGNCVRLRYVNLNGNKIDTIPEQMGKCILLEVLQLQNNFVTTLPSSFGNILALRILELQNNKLTFLPPEIAKIPTIEEIHCEGNKDLTMVPDDMRKSSDMVIWALRLHRDHQDKIGVKVEHYDELEEKARESEEQRLRMNDSNSNVMDEIRNLEEIRPIRYIALKAKVKQMKARAKCVIL